MLGTRENLPPGTTFPPALKTVYSSHLALTIGSSAFITGLAEVLNPDLTGNGKFRDEEGTWSEYEELDGGIPRSHAVLYVALLYF